MTPTDTFPCILTAYDANGEIAPICSTVADERGRWCDKARLDELPGLIAAVKDCDSSVVRVTIDLAL